MLCNFFLHLTIIIYIIMIIIICVYSAFTLIGQYKMGRASRRASAQAVISKWQLRTTSPMNTNSSVGENWFSAKNGLWPGRL